jgi:hypothetical protein
MIMIGNKAYKMPSRVELSPLPRSASAREVNGVKQNAHNAIQRYLALVLSIDFPIQYRINHRVPEDSNGLLNQGYHNVVDCDLSGYFDFDASP